MLFLFVLYIILAVTCVALAVLAYKKESYGVFVLNAGASAMNLLSILANLAVIEYNFGHIVIIVLVSVITYGVLTDRWGNDDSHVTNEDIDNVL